MTGKSTAIHPGVMLREDYMAYYDMDCEELARKINVDSSVLEEFVNERIPMNLDLSSKLGKLMEINENYWINLQINYEMEVAIFDLKVAIRESGNPLTLKEIDRQKMILTAFAAADLKTEFDSVHAQKIMFLIDREVDRSIGVPYFNHVPYKHGPNDHELNSTLNRLAEENFIRIVNGRQWNKRKYVLKPKGRKIGKDILGIIPAQAKEQITDIVNWAIGLDWKELKNEIYRKYPDMDPKNA